MIITEAMIRKLQKKVDVSYEEAEKYLKRAGGNVEMAEKYARKKENSFIKRCIRLVERFIDFALTYRIHVSNDEEIFMNIPILSLVLLVVFAGVDKTVLIVIVFVAVALFSNCNMVIQRVERKKKFSFYKTVEKSKEKGPVKKQEPTSAKVYKEMVPKPTEEVKVQKVEGEYVDEDEDEDYYEVTIDK